jgi:hypothetical protein
MLTPLPVTAGGSSPGPYWIDHGSGTKPPCGSGLWRSRATLVAWKRSLLHIDVGNAKSERIFGHVGADA